MSDSIKTYCFSGVMQDGKACTSGSLSIVSYEGVDISCIRGWCIDFSLQEGAPSHCITFQFDCDSCDCDPINKTICFCSESGECPGGCEYCNDEGVCVSSCPPGQVCVNDEYCGNCSTDNDCKCNQECVQGLCQCDQSTPYLGVDGCCYECLNNTQCDPCEVCLGGTCVPKECPGGHCNPMTGNCSECYTNDHCGANECCVGGACECCTGYYRDPLSGLCVQIPECFTSEDCPDCQDCVNYNCVQRVCPPGQTCVGDNCVDGCKDPEDCPPGFGCLNNTCVPCSSLSCAGGVSLCAQAKGCECINNTCQYVDCTILDECVVWSTTPPVVVPGTPVPGSGLPALIFSVVYEDLGLVPMSGGQGLFRDYRFTMTETTGATGVWTANGGTLGNGNSVSFKLSDPTPLQWNNVGFEVEFAETGTSRTGSIVVYNQNWFDPDPADPNNSYFEDLFTNPANWIIDVQANAVPPSTTGGSVTAGSMKLCPCNPSAKIVGWTWTTLEGNLTVTLTPTSDGCMNATVQGCGTGQGTVTIDCAGYMSTIPIPPLPFDYSAANCCDPLTDPTCQGTPGDGSPCPSITILQADLVVSESNFVLGSGNGLFRAVFQPDSIGLSIKDWIRIGKNLCWNTTGSAVLSTQFFNFAPLYQHFEWGSGAACIQAGYNCQIKIDKCSEVRAEACLEGCTSFEVDILRNGNVFTALPSIGNGAQLTYHWYENATPAPTDTSAYPSAVSLTNTYNLPNPNTSVNYITVNVVRNVNGVLCYAQAIYYLTLDAVSGCTDPFACNWNSAATVEDGSCCYLSDPIYQCSTGLVLRQICPGLTYEIQNGNTPIPYTNGMSLDPGTRTIIGRKDGLQVCSATVSVPTCYTCDDGDCVAGTTLGANRGEYTNDSTCGYQCGCNIAVALAYECVFGKTSILITGIQGGSGNYLLTIQDPAGNVLVGPDLPISGSGISALTPYVSPPFCFGEYRVFVQDANGIDGSCPPIIFDSACIGCGDDENSFSLSQYLYKCPKTRFEYTINPDPCSQHYKVFVYKNFVHPDNLLAPFAPDGIEHHNITAPFTNWVNYTEGPSYIPDGDYYYVIQDLTRAGCTRTYVTASNCNNSLPDCTLDAFEGNYVEDINSGLLSFSFDVDLVGTGTFGYTVGLYLGDGLGNPIGSPIVEENFVLSPGAYTGVPLAYTMPAPSVGTYYVMKISGQSPLAGDCFLTDQLNFVPRGQEAVCAISTFSVANYNVALGGFQINWNAVNTSGSLTLRRTVWGSATCGVGGSTVTTVTGLPNIGVNQISYVPQLDGQARCVQFELFDAAEPSCSSGIVDKNVPACTCAVELLDVSYNTSLGQIEYEYNAECPTVPIGFTVEIIERSTAGCGGTSTVLTSFSHNTAYGTGYYAITAPGPDRYIQVVITDDTNALCTDSTCITIEGCVPCTTQTALVPGTRIGTLVDTDGTSYVLNGTNNILECVDVGDPSTLNDNFVSSLETVLTAGGICGTIAANWSIVANPSTDCLSTTRALVDISGTHSGQTIYRGLVVNGTTYDTTIVLANWVAGNPTLVTGAYSDVQEHIVGALAAEGVPASEVAFWVATSTNTVTWDINITGIDNVAHTVSVRDIPFSGNSTTVQTTSTTAGCAALPGTPLPGPCLQIEITGAGQTFDYFTSVGGANDYPFDVSGC